MISNKLKITVLNGCDISCDDLTKRVKPYCLLQIGCRSCETKCSTDGNNPQWNEEVWFEITPGHEVLSLSIRGKIDDKGDVIIGAAFVNVGSFKSHESTTVSVKLIGHSGCINLEILPMYETAVTRMDKMDRKIKRLTLDNNACKGKLELLNTQINNLSTENHRIKEIGKSSEKCDISGYVMLTCDTVMLDPSNVTTENGRDCPESNGGLPRGDCVPSLDQFDIITEGDVPTITNKPNKNAVEFDLEDEDKENSTVVNIPPKITLDERILTLDDWGRHLSESISVIDKEIVQLGRKESIVGKLKKYSHFDKSVGLKLLLENIELAKTLIELEVDDNHLNELVSQIKNHGVHNSRIRIDKIDQIIDGKIAEVADLKLSDAMASLDVSVADCELENSFHQVTSNKAEETSRHTPVSLDTDWCEITVDKRASSAGAEKRPRRRNLSGGTLDETDCDTLVSNMSADSINQRFRRELSEKEKARITSELEYFWDDFLPKSISQTNVTSEQENHRPASNNDVLFEEIDNMAHAMTENVDEFIKNNYLTNEKDIVMDQMMQSNQSLWTEIEEEAQHFKDINIRLIKENEGLVGNVHALEKQIYNLDRMQQILFHQLNQRVPVDMKDVLNTMYELYDTSEEFEEEEEEDYSKSLIKILDRLVGRRRQFSASTTSKDDVYLPAVSLLYHEPSLSL